MKITMINPERKEKGRLMEMGYIRYMTNKGTAYRILKRD